MTQQIALQFIMLVSYFRLPNEDTELEACFPQCLLVCRNLLTFFCPILCLFVLLHLLITCKSPEQIYFLFTFL